MRRLALGLPTALQIHKNWAILFHKDGVSQLADLRDYVTYRALTFPSDNHPQRVGDDPEQMVGGLRRVGDDPRRIWALIDTNPHLLEPADVFKHPSHFFVVDATSPRSDYLGWLNKVSYEKFYMKPWSLSEILQAYVDKASGAS
jgi:hypothetical protein